MRERVEEALQSIRPYLQADGGDVELVDVTEDGTVYVSLVGACGGCPMSQMTLRNGVEAAIKEQVPEVQRVETVDWPGVCSTTSSTRGFWGICNGEPKDLDQVWRQQDRREGGHRQD